MKFPALDVPIQYQGPDGPVSIYALVDPVDRTIRYVGRSVNPRARLRTHVNEPCNPRLKMWIANLTQDGMRPLMVELERTDEARFPQAERRWIARYRALGDIYNDRDGAPDGQSAYKPVMMKRQATGRAAGMFMVRIEPAGREFLERAAEKLSERSPSKVGLGPFLRWAALQHAEKLLGVSLADYDGRRPRKGGGR